MDQYRRKKDDSDKEIIVEANKLEIRTETKKQQVFAITQQTNSAP